MNSNKTRLSYDLRHENVLLNALRRLGLWGNSRLPRPEERDSGVAGRSAVYFIYLPGSNSTGDYIVAKFDEPCRSAKEWSALRELSKLAPSRALVTPHPENAPQDKVLIFPAVQTLAGFMPCQSLLSLCRSRVAHSPRDCVSAFQKVFAILGADFYSREPGEMSFASDRLLTRWESAFPNLSKNSVRTEITLNALTNWQEVAWHEDPYLAVTVGGIQRRLPNPFLSLVKHLKRHTGPLMMSRIHGDLNLTNVIVSLRSNGEIDDTFVIDFANCRSHRVQALDFARLETEIWRNILASSETETQQLSGQAIIEEFLCVREFLDGTAAEFPKGISDHVRGCAILVDELRRIAKSHLKSPTDTTYVFRDYMESLYFTSVEVLKHYDVFSSPVKSKIMILSAALCRNFLNEVSEGYYGRNSSHRRWTPPRNLYAILGKETRTPSQRTVRHSISESKRLQIAAHRRMARFHQGGIPPRKQLFGRQEDLKAIDEERRGQRTTVLCIRAEGGVGKSQLVHEWLWRKAGRTSRKTEIFCFSFNSQGTAENRQTSSGPFFREIFQWLKLKTSPTLTAEQQAERLANTICDRGVILYLDGLEPLQNQPHQGGASLKDPGVRDLVDRLAVSGHHFCIITTRYRIEDLGQSYHLKQIELDELSPEAAVELLKEHTVWGEHSRQLFNAAKKWGYHALSIELLGSYLKNYCAGDIRGADTIRAPLYRSDTAHYRPQEMLRAYDAILKPLDKQILRILGLFDRPVEEEVFWDLASPAIPNVSDQLAKVDSNERRAALRKLADLRLLHINELEDSNRIQIDCHALVRRYQSETLQAEFPRGWRDANARLFHHFSKLPSRRRPSSPTEMDMLYRAVAHGCAAGLHSAAFDEVYWPRISRRKDYFSTGQLGLVAEDLAALASFFDLPSWTKTAPDLSLTLRARLFSLVGFRLRTLGRLREAQGAIEQALKCFESLKEKGSADASYEANNLAVLQRMQGNLKEAIKQGKKALKYAKSPEDKLHRMGALAEFYHYTGRQDEALKMFKEAERLQAERVPKRPLLYSTLGFRYCEMLLTLRKTSEVLRRTRAMRSYLVGKTALLDKGLSYLCEGRALLQSAANPSHKLLRRSEIILRKADKLVSQSQHRDNQIRTWVSLAECLRMQGRLKEASAMTKKADWIAKVNGMWFHKLDCEFENLLIDATANTTRGITSSLEKLAKRASAIRYQLLRDRIQRMYEEL